MLHLLGGLPFLRMRDLVYDDRFFEEIDAESDALYTELVGAVMEMWAPRSVVDVGCGTGLMLAKLAERGVAVRGVEGSIAAIRRSRVGDRIVRADLERGVPRLGRFDLCLCIEVAEHLRPRSARRLVEGLAHLSDVVVFTAARPGQPGIAHLNPQPKSYWRSLFEAKGFASSPRDSELIWAIQDVPEPEYIHANLMVFERRVDAVDQDLRRKSAENPKTGSV